MNILLVFFPIGLVAGALGWADLTVFFLNFLAIIPLASLIAFSTRELSGSVGVVLGRLLKATLSNIFEIIVRDPMLPLVIYSAFLSNMLCFRQGWGRCCQPGTDRHCSVEPVREHSI
jgi:Ca2+/H+ antiporter